MYYVYVLQNEANKDDFYLGYSANLKQRFEDHNSGKNKSTKGRKWRLVYYEAYISKSAAIKREAVLKKDGRSRRHLMQRVKDSLE